MSDQKQIYAVLENVKRPSFVKEIRYALNSDLTRASETLAEERAAHPQAGANLRRAVSVVYYALFHLLARGASKAP